MVSQSNPTTFRPKTNLVTLAFLYIFIAGINVSSWYTSSIKTCFELALISVAVGIVLYLGFGKPQVIFFDEGLTIVNPTETFTFGWGEVEGIDSHFTMRIFVGDRIIGAWVAPTPSRRQAKKVFNQGSVPKNSLKGLGIDVSLPVSPGDLAESDSGAAAAIARIRLQEFSRTANPIRIESSQTKSYLALIVAGLLALIGSALILASK